MKKVCVNLSFRYDVKVIIEADDEWEHRNVPEEIKSYILEKLNFELGDTGAISDWSFEAEEVKE